MKNKLSEILYIRVDAATRKIIDHLAEKHQRRYSDLCRIYVMEGIKKETKR